MGHGHMKPCLQAGDKTLTSEPARTANNHESRARPAPAAPTGSNRQHGPHLPTSYIPYATRSLHRSSKTLQTDCSSPGKNPTQSSVRRLRAESRNVRERSNTYNFGVVDPGRSGELGILKHSQDKEACTHMKLALEGTGSRTKNQAVRGQKNRHLSSC